MSRQRKVLMLQGSYNPSIHKGIAQAARAFNWHLDISLMRSSRLPKHWEGDGIICNLNQEERFANFIRRNPLPCVDTSIWRSDLKMPRVSTSNSRIGQLAARHFIEQGHRNFAWYAFHKTPWGELRFEAFREVLGQSGLEAVRLDRGLTQNTEHIRRQLRQLPRPTAIFTQNDFDAAWLLNRCLDEGWQVPDDFAILGVDNNPLICQLQPIPLSSVSKDSAIIGYSGCRLLQRLMEGKPVSNKIHYIEPERVIVRASTETLAIADPLVRKAMQYMNDNLRHSFGVEQLAAHCGTHRLQLEKQFKNALRTTAHQKLIELRIKKAESLLLTTRDSVEQIANLTGFCHAPHLTRVFKNHFGLPPHKYRRAHATPVQAFF
ncbi:substrate-binding domain-containing protein [Puniceicoccales bacterium CK1056]|uniref:Substrate-binding domain-containing protein n=1 Tax=Oceanipulchritudo coccoides TaxID=2706888 RepID=A0A6B2M406_9BACT|nr:xylose operon transcription regulator XylR [Oceanipulchritudo coccoides]NDV62834.1 substrate-binding domain-containing protein [Oceanipulchritudo coccoides]